MNAIKSIIHGIKTGHKIFVEDYYWIHKKEYVCKDCNKRWS